MPTPQIGSHTYNMQYQVYMHIIMCNVFEALNIYDKMGAVVPKTLTQVLWHFEGFDNMVTWYHINANLVKIWKSWRDVMMCTNITCHTYSRTACASFVLKCDFTSVSYSSKCECCLNLWNHSIHVWKKLRRHKRIEVFGKFQLTLVINCKSWRENNVFFGQLYYGRQLAKIIWAQFHENYLKVVEW
jgi:hypothetical protein